MNVAQLQLVLGRLTSPAAAEKPDLAGYEAQGEFPGWGRGVVPHGLTPRRRCWASGRACAGRAARGGRVLARAGAGPLYSLRVRSHGELWPQQENF